MHLLVEVAGKVGEGVLPLDDGGAFRIGSQLCLKVLEDGALGHAQGTRNVHQILDVGFHAVESALLGQLHLWHFVTEGAHNGVRLGSGEDGTGLPIVRVIVLALWDANVGCHCELSCGLLSRL